jgi:uncharacterized membrane protein
MSRKSNHLACFSGLALAGAGLAHFTSPQLFEPIVKPAFPHNTRQQIYTNGVIEAVLGLSFSARQTRSLAIIGYGAYLGGNALRSTQTT